MLSTRTLFILIFFGYCLQVMGCKEKNARKSFLIKKKDSANVIIKEALEYRNSLLIKFNESSIKNQEKDGYHLMFYSSHGIGESVKFEKNDSTYFLYVNCIKKNNWPSKCKDLKIEISKEDWDGLEKLIEEFDFWTESEFRKNEGVLDGYVYFLEANKKRPNQWDKNYRIVGRSSTRYDKIEALCENILEYKNELHLKHSQQGNL